MTAGNQPSSSGSGTALLPCPFCGGEATYDTDWEMDGGPGERIVCLVCDAQTVWLEMGNKEASIKAWNARAPRPVDPAQGAPGPVQDTYLVGGPPDLKAMSGSVESDRVIQLHFRRKATDDDRKWLLEAINQKLATDSAVTPSPGPGEWTADQFWEYVGAMAGEFEAGQMRDMLAAKGLMIAPIRGSGGWQTIETAPKDRRILGWDGDEVATVDWNGRNWWVQVSDSGRATVFNLTHWMSAPTGPSMSSTTCGGGA